MRCKDIVRVQGGIMEILYMIMTVSTTLILLSVAVFLVVFLVYMLYEFVTGWL